MTNERKGSRSCSTTCLSEEDFYNFIAQPAEEFRSLECQSHLVACSRCREELAELLRILHPEPHAAAEAIPQPDADEIEQTLKLIQNATQQEEVRGTRIRHWQPWAAAAAILICLSYLAFDSVVERRRSNAFYAQARTALEEVYDSKSPKGLRLNLPFESSASRRNSSASDDTLNTAENYLLQALAVRDGMQEARLGLGYIYLSKGQFTKAREQFQEVLDRQGGNTQALLGRGATSFEEGSASKNPVDRAASMVNALSDFERVLKQNPVSGEARYNKAWTFYEVGRHKAALDEISAYLSLDSTSLWAEKLKTLQTQIRMTRSEAVEREVNRAALARDAGALETLARLVPYQLPAALRTILQRSLAAESTSASGTPDASALRWASEIMETSYSAATGDRSGAQLLKFYGGLSPPQRQTKRLLDARLKELIDLHRDGKLQAAIRDSEPLIREFDSLGDHWQLVNLHNLRGTSFYYQSADFNSALREYRKMHHSAESSGSPDLVARALASLASVYLDKRKFDDARASLTELKSLAETYKMDTWLAFAFRNLGVVHLRLNQFEQSLHHYSSALGLAYRLMNESIVLGALENIGVALEKLGRLGEARTFYNEAMRWQESFIQEGTEQAAPALVARRLNLFYKQGNLALRMNDLAAAESFFQKGLESSKRGMKELEARNRVGLAEVYLRQRQLDAAADELRKAQALSAPGQYPELEWQAQTLLGSVLKERGDKRAALAHFESSIRILENIGRTISSSDSRQTYLNQRFDPYGEIVSLSYYLQHDKSKTLDYVEGAKSMRLQAYLDAPLDRSGQSSPAEGWAGAGGTRMSAAIPNDFTTLEYFLASGELFIFISGQGRLDTVTLRISPSELERQVQSYLASIKGNDRVTFEAQSRKLYDQLLEPALRRVDHRKTETLVIIPDGPLHLLPFSGLRDGEGRYLIERHAIAYAPSRRIFQYCLSLDKESATGRDRSLLLLDGSSNLAGASEELAYLTRLFGQKTNLMESTNLVSLGRRVGDYEIIHFSGHATTSNGRPSLVFSSGATPNYLDASAIGNWNLQKNRLVILAGCNTGVGPRAEGESSWGLLPAFLNAGAPALMVSLLPVDDSATRNLTARFYDLLVQGSTPKAKALQQAQISLLKHSRAELNAPLSWIPFVLVGDPR